MLQCFVAMAIGMPETDRLFTQIRRALRAIGVNAYRVDTIEHNNNIDTQIMRELLRCDLAIADLTFARPSVYFEAGFAESRVKVIYTCRKDHFRSRPNDEHGNFRVHFDLQMRNIIQWKSFEDSQFLARLAKRTGKVVAPLLRSNAEADFRREEAKSFGRLSKLQQEHTIIDTFRRLVPSKRTLPTQQIGSHEWYGARKKARAVYLFKFMLLDKESPTTIVEYAQHDWLIYRKFFETIYSAWPRPVEIHKTVVLASVHGLSDSHIRVMEPDASRTESGGYAWSQAHQWLPSSRTRNYDDVFQWSPRPRTLREGEMFEGVQFQLLPRIKSSRDLAVRIRPLIAASGFARS